MTIAETGAAEARMNAAEPTSSILERHRSDFRRATPPPDFDRATPYKNPPCFPLKQRPLAPVALRGQSVSVRSTFVNRTMLCVLIIFDCVPNLPHRPDSPVGSSGWGLLLHCICLVSICSGMSAAGGRRHKTAGRSRTKPPTGAAHSERGYEGIDRFGHFAGLIAL